MDMLHVQNGVYLLVTSPAEHHYTYTEGRSGATKLMLTPFLSGEKIVASGYNGYMQGFEPSPHDYIYSGITFAQSGGTQYEYTQAAETVGDRTRYYRYQNGTKNTNQPSYDEPGEFTFVIIYWAQGKPGEPIIGTARTTWRYKNANGTYGTVAINITNVIFRQGDRTQTDYAYSISESIS